MSPDQAVELARSAVVLTLLLSVPIMGVATLVGLLISIAQAVTQIQDQTLSFVPKIILMLVTTLLLLPWSITLIVEYSEDLFHSIPGMF
ncbi:flagellar biosynthesis protein FliQ [Symmachiella dynata]|jgi:flagellar biosynthesis protein FliQ|uniref:Flagellar biosynthetic protein FliQ n=1 Tax=Symmachiella dynata TaxID=2527995 RepID=A0A517ZGN7_9PLAN|nr:flagellar biosynthesis protein FliQ [Symmachiella dynata]QDT46086.1 Flagellar biosynthetic protein FliQ [Symmachiella dynata]QDU41653.1 Flagellar biosynthetic protein FliQ [Symmachiella dynata]|tara:strand:- start:616 stop:882 length:267 start_codon:yes stop_codon:yes gene_type:complete